VSAGADTDKLAEMKRQVREPVPRIKSYYHSGSAG